MKILSGINSDLFFTHPHWPAVTDVCVRLRQHGYVAFLAGGCVRDLFLQRKPKDFDVATDATPDEVLAVFPGALDVGKAFGVIAIPMSVSSGQGFSVEVTSFRSDGDYGDGRHPNHIEFSNPEEDAKRRDFTINAMFFDIEKSEVIDYVGGLNDLRKKLLQTVGVAEKRFAEDRLRVLRAARFAAELGFQVEGKLFLAMKDFANDVVPKVSVEWVQSELEKLLLASGRVKAINLLAQSGLLLQILPALEGLLGADSERQQAFVRSKQVLGILGEETRIEVVLSLLFLPLLRLHVQQGNSTWEKTVKSVVDSLRALKFRVADVAATQSILQALPLVTREGDWTIKAEILAKPHGLALLEVWHVDLQAYGVSNKPIHELLRRYLKICDKEGRLPKSFVNGHDVAKFGFSGAKIGEVLKQVFRRQMAGDIITRHQALQWLESLSSD